MTSSAVKQLLDFNLKVMGSVAMETQQTIVMVAVNADSLRQRPIQGLRSVAMFGC